ncbi:MAG: DUF3566 domain-containing protein [Streptosporangiales bacterium]|nr:DUF3566 domain-containing protein [Streptosporangiales bacterium]
MPPGGPPGPGGTPAAGSPSMRGAAPGGGPQADPRRGPGPGWQGPPPPGAGAPPPGGAPRGNPAAPGGPGTAAPTGGQAPAAAAARAAANSRKAHLALTRVEPWSVMKFSFVISLVCFVILFVAVALIYGVLAGLGVFEAISGTVNDLTSGDAGEGGVNAARWFSAGNVLGYTALIGALNVFLITAVSTVGAMLYNATAVLVGGVEVTLSEVE